MDYKNLIKNWHAKALDEDYFSKFVFEYLAFITYLRTQKYSNSNNDRIVLQKLKQNNDLKQKYLNNLTDNEKESWQKIIDELNRVRLGNASSLISVEEVKWWNHVCDADSFCGGAGCGNVPDNYQKFTNEMKGVIYGEQDWGNMVEFWRVIRDNMFHGSKDPERKRDKLVVEHGYKTLKPLVEIFLNDNQNDNNTR